MKTRSLPLAFALLLLSGCQATEHDDVIAVSGAVSALLSGDGMPADQSALRFEHDELWVDLDGFGKLQGFQAHPWNFTPGKHTYNLQLSFAPSDVPGKRDILAAQVCFVTCPTSPKETTCAGDCFSQLQAGSAEVHDVSADGKSFDLTFAFDVADAEGRVIHVEGGEAVTND